MGIKQSRLHAVADSIGVSAQGDLAQRAQTVPASVSGIGQTLRNRAVFFLAVAFDLRPGLQAGSTPPAQPWDHNT